MLPAGRGVSVTATTVVVPVLLFLEGVAWGGVACVGRKKKEVDGMYFYHTISRFFLVLESFLLFFLARSCCVYTWYVSSIC